MRHFDTMDNLTEQIAMSRQMIGATISQIDREEIRWRQPKSRDDIA